MYNRYIPNGAAYRRITEEDFSPPPRPRGQSTAQATSVPVRDKEKHLSDSERPSGAPEPPRAFLSGIPHLTDLLKKLDLKDVDTGDVLLLLILLLLFLDGSDTELLITLGLVLLLGLK